MGAQKKCFYPKTRTGWCSRYSTLDCSVEVGTKMVHVNSGKIQVNDNAALACWDFVHIKQNKQNK